ncbi:MAG: DUF2723 domain-containing protein [Patescibacteria group bacterium]|jgi:hypothetical protein
MQIVILVALVSSVLASTLLRYLWTVDAGDLATSLFLGQIAHPPGYPLYLVFGGMLKNLLPSFSVTYVLSLSSAVASVLTLIVLYKLYRHVYRHFFGKDCPWYLSAGALLITYFTPLWWLYSISQEVFMWTIFFLSFVVLIITRALIKENVSRKEFFMGLIVLFFGIFHQYILVLLLPFYIFAYLYKYRVARLVDLSGLFLAAVAGFTPYVVFLGKTVQSTVPHLWFPTDSLAKLFFIALRMPYGTLSLFSDPRFSDFSTRFISLGTYLNELFEMFSILLVIALFGIIVSVRKSNLTGGVLLGIFLLFGPLLYFVYPLPLTNYMSRAISQRFLLYSFPVISLFIFIGISQIELKLSTLTKKGKLLSWCVGLTVFFVAGLLFLKYFTYFRELSHYTGLERYARNVLNLLPKNSLLVVKSDPFAMPIQYVSVVQGYRPDVTVFIAMHAEHEELYEANRKYLTSRKILMPKKSKDLLNDLVLLNSRTRPVFTNFHIEGFKRYKQMGPLYQVSEQPVAIDSTKALAFYHDIKYITGVSREMFPLYGILEVKKYLVKSLNFFINHYNAKKNYNYALKFYKVLNSADPSNETMYAMGVLYYKQNDCRNAYKMWEKAFKVYAEPLVAERLSQLSAACFKDLRQANFWNIVYKYAESVRNGGK